MNSKSSATDTLYRPMQRQTPVEIDDSLYDTMTTPEYDNALNQQNVPPVPATAAGGIGGPEHAQEEEWQAELAKLEQEIATLRSVLGVKVQQAGEIKRKLGLGVITEMKQDVRQGLQSIRESDAYQKTNDAVQQIGDSITTSEAYQKTNAAFRTFGNFASRKLGDMRNSPTYRSMEDRIGGAYGSVKLALLTSLYAGHLPLPPAKVQGSQSENSFEAALDASEAQGDAKLSSATPTAPPEKAPL